MYPGIWRRGKDAGAATYTIRATSALLMDVHTGECRLVLGRCYCTGTVSKKRFPHPKAKGQEPLSVWFPGL